MYLPAHFQAKEDGDILKVISGGGAVDLISNFSGKLNVSTLPMLHRPLSSANGNSMGTLVGHLAKANPQLRDGTGSDALVIFRGPTGYISPAWYPTKLEHGKVVPTWDYIAVHVYGKLILHDERDWKLGLVTELTNHHESSFEKPWSVSDAPADFIEGQLKAIVGVEVEVDRVEAKFKLSQNRSRAEIDGVILNLRLLGHSELADAVEEACATKD